MARAIWKGSIRFGLVEIPVGLVPAEQPRELELTMLDRRDLSPVGYARYDEATEEEVPWSEIVCGYEYEDGEYEVLGDEDLRRAAPERTQAVDILQLVERAEIDPILYNKPNDLEPTRRNSKGYEPCDPERFADEYPDAVLARVEAMVRSGETHVLTAPDGQAEEAPSGREVIDLMPLLEKSLQRKGGVAARRSTSARSTGAKNKAGAKKAARRRSA